MNDAVKLHQQGRSVKEISRALRISEPEVYRHLVEHQKEANDKAKKAAKQVTDSRRAG